MSWFNFGLVRLIRVREGGKELLSEVVSFESQRYYSFEKPGSDLIIPQLASHELQRHRANESLDHFVLQISYQKRILFCVSNERAMTVVYLSYANPSTCVIRIVNGIVDGIVAVLLQYHEPQGHGF